MVERLFLEVPRVCGTSFVDLYVFVLSCVCYVFVRVIYSKPVLSGHTRRPKIGFPDKLSLSEGFKYCRML